jgi:hypothetical protein
MKVRLPGYETLTEVTDQVETVALTLENNEGEERDDGWSDQIKGDGIP